MVFIQATGSNLSNALVVSCTELQSRVVTPVIVYPDVIGNYLSAAGWKSEPRFSQFVPMFSAIGEVCAYHPGRWRFTYVSEQ